MVMIDEYENILILLIFALLALFFAVVLQGFMAFARGRKGRGRMGWMGKGVDRMHLFAYFCLVCVM